MVLGPLLSAGVGIASIASQNNAQRDQRNLGYLNLYEQKRQARERERLAKATRSDAYGNKVVYKPGIGFVTETTPLTSAILNAQQKEQLAQFRDDAPRIRAAAERTDKRAKQAGEVYDEQFNKYRYGNKKTEKEYVAEAVREAAVNYKARNRKSRNGSGSLATLALRTGNSGQLPQLLAAARQQEQVGGTLAEAIAEAKRIGKQQFHAEKGAELQTTFGELNQLQATADKVTPTNFNWNNENAALSGRQDNALSQLIQTNAQNSQAIGNAYNTVAQAAGKSPDFGILANSLSKINLPQGQSPQNQKLADLLLQQKLGTAQLGIYRNNEQLAKYKSNIGSF